MKKIVSIILFSAVGSSASAQSFERGNMVFSVGAGTGIYKTTLTYKSSTFNWLHEDTSGATIFPLSFEYRVPHWIRPGIRVTYTDYKEQKGMVNKKQNARVFDFMAGINPSFFSSKYADLFISAEYGYSQLKQTEYRASGPLAALTGAGYSFGMNARFYFGKVQHFSLHVRYSHEGYNYKILAFSDDAANSSFHFKRSGNIFGMALQYKL